MIYRLLDALPIVFLVIALSQVLGFLLLHEPYFAGAWTLTSIMCTAYLVSKQRYLEAKREGERDRAAARYLSTLVVEYIDKDSKVAGLYSEDINKDLTVDKK